MSKKLESHFELTLFDDASTREKHTAIDKWDIMGDDSRNPDCSVSADLEEFLEWGKKYRVTLIVEEV